MKSRALGGEKNLVYTAPTGGGNSLIADILMLKRIIETPGKKALLVLPYVALVQEKMRWLRKAVDGITKISGLSRPGEQRTSHWRLRGDEDCVRLSNSSVTVRLKRHGMTWTLQSVPLKR